MENLNSTLLSSVNQYEKMLMETLRLEKIKPFSLDHYHKSCCKLLNNDNQTVAIIKCLDGSHKDNVDNLALYDLAVNDYAASLTNKVLPRKALLYIPTTPEAFGLIAYEPLGEALTYETSISEITVATKQVLLALEEIHFKTTSSEHGKKILKDPDKVSKKDICWKTTHYLFSDIQKGNLPFGKEIVDLTTSKWFPIFLSAKKFAMTHRDPTLSNVIKTPKDTYTLIDWSYSIWQDPCYDIANSLFWLIIYGLHDVATIYFQETLHLYKQKGFDIDLTFPYFLARRFIDQGKYTDDFYIEIGYELLKTNSFNQALSSSTKLLQSIPQHSHNLKNRNNFLI